MSIGCIRKNIINGKLNLESRQSKQSKFAIATPKMQMESEFYRILIKN